VKAAAMHDAAPAWTDCPRCKQPVGTIELVTTDAVWYLCASCEHRWVTEAPSASPAETLRMSAVATPPAIFADWKRK
jgi:hypothetical protein